MFDFTFFSHFFFTFCSRHDPRFAPNHRGMFRGCIGGHLDIGISMVFRKRSGSTEMIKKKLLEKCILIFLRSEKPWKSGKN